MPLIHGKSDRSFVKNLKTEMHAGKPQKQALAIAYSEKRRAEHHKMAEGGDMEEQPVHEKEEFMDMVAQECMEAIQAKDGPAFRAALEALVMHALDEEEAEEPEHEESME
jgi:hypothetical protein